MPAGPSSRSTKAANTPSSMSSTPKPSSLSSHATTSSNTTTQRHQQQQQQQQEESKEHLTTSSSTSPNHLSSASRLTTASTSASSTSYTTKTPLLVERAVIHDSLVRNSLHSDLTTKYDAGMLGTPDTIDVLTATTLLLSFKNLVVIDHLSAFTRLTKLQLDNNHITKIQNLDTLVNLTWLDLSFNQISCIEGLDSLVQLTDLALSHNSIESIGEHSLSHLYPTLQCLTLSNNCITSMDEIKRLRPFTALRLLVLKDNPIHVQQPEEYQLNVLAFLTQLVYFDYIAVEDNARLKARDNKLDAVLLLESRESEERKGIEELDVRVKRSERNRLIGCCEGMERMWDVMLDKDVELRKLRALPGVNERVAVCESKVDGAVREYEEEMCAVGEKKREEEERVREAMDSINQRAEQECKVSLKQFQRDKKQLRAQYDQLLSHPPPHNGSSTTAGATSYTSPTSTSSLPPPSSSPLLPTLTALLNRYHTLLHTHISHLMLVQSDLTHNTSLLLTAFDSALHELSIHWSTRTQQAFQSLLAISKQYHDGLHDHIAVLLETASTTTTNTSTKDDTTNNKVNDKPNIDGRTDTEPIAANSSVGGGRVLLSDKEGLMSAMSASRDCHDNLIMAKEDELREKEERDMKERLSKCRQNMVEQNRARVAEIYEIKKREERVIEEMMEKLSGDDEEDESDTTEQR